MITQCSRWYGICPVGSPILQVVPIRLGWPDKFGNFPTVPLEIRGGFYDGEECGTVCWKTVWLNARTLFLGFRLQYLSCLFVIVLSLYVSVYILVRRDHLRPGTSTACSQDIEANTGTTNGAATFELGVIFNLKFDQSKPRLGRHYFGKYQPSQVSIAR